MSLNNYQHSISDRFMRYVQIDTQSDPNSPTCPSTEKQKKLGKNTSPGEGTRKRIMKQAESEVSGK